MQHVVMVVPVDADNDEAEDVTDEHRAQRCDRVEILAVRHFHLEHHDGDDDGDDAVAECFQPAFAHAALVSHATRWFLGFLGFLRFATNSSNPSHLSRATQSICMAPFSMTLKISSPANRPRAVSK